MAALAVILLLILLFGGLGIFVAKAFFIVLVVLAVIAMAAGAVYIRR
ncbi:hypothetical protein J0H33_13735 [bacterium]|nr:hypothetical protein [bacterium]